MQFVRQGDCFKVARTTGPQHNLLVLEFCEPGEVAQLTMELLPAAPNESHKLDVNAVRAMVVEGVEEGNREHGTNYRVKRIRFVPNDSPPVDTYRLLARSLVERLAKGLPFIEAGSESNA